jgi:homogentisate 1,2-dioxygenase
VGAFFHNNLDYCETLGYHVGRFFSRGGVFSEGMVSVHPVGLPHGPHPTALAALLDDKRPQRFEEVGIMADFATRPASPTSPSACRGPATWRAGQAT